ncbi:hypothetical protein ADUPG1_005213, partial [Aduncisulcus paluster]
MFHGKSSPYGFE